MPIMAIKSKKLIHRGDKTQIQGHVMYPVSLRPTNKTVSKPVKPMPDEEEELLIVEYRVALV